VRVDPRLLKTAYDRSAEGYDARFRELQRPKFRAAAPWLSPPGGSLCLDAGGGTGLFFEWAAEERRELLQARWLLIDLSLGMLRLARPRTALLAAADLARAPLRPASCALVCAFTSVLDRVERALHELSALVAPRGILAVTFLRAEAPRSLPLPVLAQAEAGQDRVFIMRKES
jgi:SAM-dependent methyltransferase